MACGSVAFTQPLNLFLPSGVQLRLLPQPTLCSPSPLVFSPLCLYSVNPALVQEMHRFAPESDSMECIEYIWTRLTLARYAIQILARFQTKTPARYAVKTLARFATQILARYEVQTLARFSTEIPAGYAVQKLFVQNKR